MSSRELAEGGLVYVAAYLVAIVAANLIIAAVGPAGAIPVAFAFVGFDLVCRDKLHDAWRGRSLWPRMLALIAAGGVLSYLVNRDAAAIAIASTVAFVLAALADALVYRLVERREWMERSNLSNLAGAAVDSLAFSPLAFGVILPAVILGQFAAKVAGGLVWSWLLRRRYRELEPWELEYQTAPDPEVDL